MIKITPIAEILKAEEYKNRKKSIENIADKLLAKFNENLDANKVKLTSISDFERVAKLLLTLSGKPIEITEVNTNQNVIVDNINLDQDSPEVKELYEYLYNRLNKINNREK